MIDIVKLLNGNVAIYDNTSGDFLYSLSPAIIEMQCSTNGTVRVVQNNDNFEFFDPAQVANTQVLPAAAISFSGTCADLADILATDFFFELAGDDLASILANGNNAGAYDIDMNGNDILNVTNINGSPYPPTSLGTVTSVGLTMPTAFNVANSPITSAGTINVTGAGLTSQYVRGDGTLANFPTNVGGGSSVSYYLNGSINQGTFGGNVYLQMSKTAILGGGTNFTINANGYIAQFLTDAGDPALLNIPAGNWDFQLYFSASSSGGSPQFYTELYKYDGTTFTLIASGSTSPENITGGTFADIYVSTLAVPATTLTLTDRLAIRIYVTHSGRIITLYTEDNKLAEVHTTFSTGIAALNGLTSQIQNFSTGTTGTDFNISSSSSTHTFNLPTASALNRGLLNTTDWTAFNGKESVLTFSSPLSRTVNTISIPVATSLANGYLSSTDWTTFNNKQNALGYTPVTDARTISTTYPLSGGGDLTANRTISISQATTSTDGYLSSSDWNTFNGKQNALGYTPVTDARTLTINGTTFDLTANRTWSVGTVTSVAALTLGTSGTDLSSTVATGTTTPIITLNVPTASATNRGVLSSSDWSAFNGKQNALGFTPVPETRTLTINGTTQDLSANRTFTIADPEGWTVIVKSANQDVTGSTMTDDTELKFSVVSGGNYMLQLILATSGNSSTDDYKFDFALSTGLMIGGGNYLGRTAANATSTIAINASNAISSTAMPVGQNGGTISTSSGIITVTADFAFYVNSNTTFKVRFACNTGTTSIARTWKGSILKYKRID